MHRVLAKASVTSTCAIIAAVFTMVLLCIRIATSEQKWMMEFGDPKAKVKLEALYPIGWGGHEWVVEYVREIVNSFPGRVYALIIDWSTERGVKELEKRKLTCGAFIINGKRVAKVDGKRIEFVRSPLIGGWTKEQLKKAVAAEVQAVYGKETEKGKVKEAQAKQIVLKAFVPCGVAGPYVDIKRMFEKHNPNIKLEEKIENVLVLAKRLEAGESPDIYITLGKLEIEKLMKKRGIKQDDITAVARARISLIVPEGNPKKLKTIGDLALKDIRSIGVARAETSLGYCTQQALERLGVWEKVKGKVAYAKFPVELKSWVQKRRVDAAIVYHPCLYEAHEIGQRPKFAEKVTLVSVIPAMLHDEIPVFAIVMPTSAKAEAAKKFVQFMLTEAAQKAFDEWKFEPLKPFAQPPKGK
ncbi:MAG: substrate-binding domain-containing protein [Armatimonadota bacterium]|nr:substrate-binding domain-containing protein [Armatimonadota bacterium]MCX7777711.1 substrate-binding domain-containing protein [Armatimonadota bacterium]MDW8025874.1 substrate-binding domain-containing protein [Armatimonadota bacterium]